MSGERDYAMMGKIGAYRLHATRSAKETTAAAQAAFKAKWEREVDPEGLLDPDERAVRAHAALRAHLLRLAMKSAKVRRERRALQEKKQSAPSTKTLVDALNKHWRLG